MSLSRFGKSLLLGATLLVTPILASAQVSAIQGGVNSAANAAFGSARPTCTGTQCVVNIVANVVSIGLQFSGVLLLCYLLYAGFLWMTAPDSKQVGQAQDMIKNAVAGLLLIVVSFAISSFVLDSLQTIVTGSRPAPAAGAGAPVDGAGAGAGAGGGGA